MGRTACTEPQCLYNGDLYLYLLHLFVDMRKKIDVINNNNYITTGLYLNIMTSYVELHFTVVVYLQKDQNVTHVNK